MKIKKFENSRELDVSEKLSEMFFEQCENFGSEKEEHEKNIVKLKFYFPSIEFKELEQIVKCKDFIEDYTTFYICPEYDDNTLNFKLNKDDYYKLNEKLDLYRNSKKYNL